MMEQALEKGQQLNVLELAQLGAASYGRCSSLLMGGQWQNDTPTLRIPYYRPLIRCSRVSCQAARNSISQGKFFPVNALRPRQSISLRGFGASLGGFRRRFTLGFLYSLHAALA
ncbi:ABC transporter substrate-binding protein [Salmonella enterica subsp. enterica]|uniref:ABC transporter substrate-binding protein n=1 Tax=Salmonella enterica I TaxID=59201 RepID=A0A379V3W8_SALET|nr:ABC transporter substrate-binding protein [Salmonella enterica subsp. enterica]